MNLILQRLIDMEVKNRLHHGFLFIGKNDSTSGIVRETVSGLVEHIFTKGNDHRDIILKKISNQNHPDLLRLTSEDADIKIEQIRDMQRWLSIPPLESGKKIVVIENADHLNSACSNSLLKTLEEPPSYALIILQTGSVSRILPTIRSRLFSVQFPDSDNLDTSESKEWMEDLQAMLAKKNYTDKEIFAFTEQFSDQRTELVYFFNHIHKTIRDQMATASSFQFNRLEKVFDLALDMEQQLYQNYGNISLGLDRFFMEWRNV